MNRKMLAYAAAGRLVLGLLNAGTLLLIASVALFGDTLLAPVSSILDAGPEKVFGVILRAAFFWA